MNIVCPCCNEVMEYDRDDNRAICRSNNCSMAHTWIAEAMWRRFALADEMKEAFDQYRVSLEAERAKYARLASLMNVWVNANEQQKWEDVAAAYATLKQFLLDRNLGSKTWDSIVCDEIDKIVKIRSAVQSSKIEKIRSLRMVDYNLFPAGSDLFFEAQTGLGLTTAKKFIEDHYNDDGSRK